MKKFKVLRSDMTTPFQGFKMELGKKYVCEDFDANIENDCSRGFYATDIEGLLYSINQNTNSRVFECEVGGQSAIVNQFKQRFETFELIREIKKPEIKRLAKAAEPELGYKLREAIYPINPLSGRPKKATEREIELLKQWMKVWTLAKTPGVEPIITLARDSVWDSVWDSVKTSVRNSIWDSVWDAVKASVWDAVWGSVRDSIRASVWNSVRDSVWCSVWDSVKAYISSLFFNIKKWKYIKHPKGVNPFQPCIDLWHSGFMPSFDGKTWRLHSGKNAKIVYEQVV